MTAADQPTTEPSEHERRREVTDALYDVLDQFGPIDLGYDDTRALAERLTTALTALAPAPQPAADTETEVQWGVRRPNGTHFKASSRDGANRVIAGRGNGARVRRIATKTTTYTPWEEA